MELNVTTSNTVDVHMGLPDFKKDFDIEFDYMVSFTEKEGSGGDVLYLMGGFTMAISAFCHPTGFSWYDNKQMNEIADFEDGKWYKMKFEVNVPSKTMSWYIDGKLAVKDAPFRQASDAITALSFGTTTGTVGTKVCVDNLTAIER